MVRHTQGHTEGKENDAESPLPRVFSRLAWKAWSGGVRHETLPSGHRLPDPPPSVCKPVGLDSNPSITTKSPCNQGLPPLVRAFPI